MAKQGGILQIQGTLENLTFYKSADGLLVRTRGGISKQRIMNDPAFVRTRENGAEFGHSANCGKLLRNAVGSMVFKAKDRRLSSRLLKLMSQLKNLDTVNERGKRTVAAGLNDPTGKLLLKGFDFNNRAALHSVLYAPIALDVLTGSVTIADFNPMEQLKGGEGATHFSLQSAYLNLDFETGVSAITYSPIVSFPITNGVIAPTLVPTVVPEGEGTQLFFLLVEFFQEVNGVPYLLNNGAFNVLNCLEVV
jgi:hypothetical protein